MTCRGTGDSAQLQGHSLARPSMSPQQSVTTQSPRSTQWGSSPCLIHTWKSVAEMRQQSMQDCDFDRIAPQRLSRCALCRVPYAALPQNARVCVPITLSAFWGHGHQLVSSGCSTCVHRCAESIDGTA